MTRRNLLAASALPAFTLGSEALAAAHWRSRPRSAAPVDEIERRGRRSCAHCNHQSGDSVYWNPFNKVVQCHACGAVA